MQIGVREAARLMNVSEKTIYRWIKQSKLPAYKVNEQYRFNRAEILEWATSNKVNVPVEMFEEQGEADARVPSLVEAIRAGGIHYRLGGSDKATVLKSVMDVMPLPAEVDRSFLYRVLMARESLGSTAIGEGIAIPHVRNPIVMHIPCPMVTVCFLEHPIEFGALDGKPVHTLFTIISPTAKLHLSLLSRLAHALRQPAFRDVIVRQGSRDEIGAAATAVDGQLAVRPAGDGGGEGK